MMSNTDSAEPHPHRSVDELLHALVATHPVLNDLPFVQRTTALVRTMAMVLPGWGDVFSGDRIVTLRDKETARAFYASEACPVMVRTAVIQHARDMQAIARRIANMSAWKLRPGEECLFFFSQSEKDAAIRATRLCALTMAVDFCQEWVHQHPHDYRPPMKRLLPIDVFIWMFGTVPRGLLHLPRTPAPGSGTSAPSPDDRPAAPVAIMSDYTGRPGRAPRRK